MKLQYLTCTSKLIWLETEEWQHKKEAEISRIIIQLLGSVRSTRKENEYLTSIQVVSFKKYISNCSFQDKTLKGKK